jgi:3-hydroxyisobutyrate dehydrogenase-like beta-hydroxyacid dehydrogenase
VGVVGLGIMGSAIAANLLRSGHDVVGYDVAASRRRIARAAGARAVGTMRELAQAVDIIISSLPSADALADVCDRIARARPRNVVVVETSTLALDVKEAARRVLQGNSGRLKAAPTKIAMLDCPISGTGAQARTGDLVLYASGDRATFDTVAPVLQGFSRAQYFLGPFGNGSKMKYVANLLVAIHNVAAAEALVLAMKAGLDPETVVKVVGEGAGGSRVLQLRGPMMARGEYADATMKMSVFQKDVAIIASFARDLGCATPLFSASESIYTAALAARHGADDTAAVCTILEKLANLERPVRSTRSPRVLRRAVRSSVRSSSQ